LGGELTRADDPEPPHFCAEHPGGTQGACLDCKASRIAHEDWTKRDSRRCQAEREAQRAKSQNCPVCHGTNVIDVGDNEARKCDHNQGDQECR
jgi:hypothetical protein